MLPYLLKVSLCWALFYLLYHLWLGQETFFKINRWYLLGTTLLGLIIPAIDFQEIFPIHEEPTIVHFMQPITLGVEQLEAVIVTAAAEEPGLGWQDILLTLYCLGALIALLRFGYGLRKINSLYQAGEKSKMDKYFFVHTPVHHLPFSFFKNLFWSKHFVVEEEDRLNILLHEEAHIFQKHSLDVLFFEIMGVLFWCNPFIYLYKKAIKTTHEYLADDYVVAHVNRKKYGRLLLRQSQSAVPVALANSFFSTQLKNRIVMMTKTRSTKMASLKYLAGLPLLALLFLAFSFEQKMPELQDRTHPVYKSKSMADSLPGEQVFQVADEMPVFPGCAEITDPAARQKCSDQKLLEFVFSNLKYPEEARKEGISGMVVASFVIEKDGSISNAKTIRSIGGGCDEETIRVVNAMPKWTPGKQDGKSVRVEYKLPVRFALESDPSKLKMDDGQPVDLAEEKVFEKVDEMPRYPGCEEMTNAEKREKCAQQKMLEFIYTHLKYPKEAQEKGIEGTSVVKFIIEKDGSIADAEIVRSIGGECDEEVLKSVYMMPKWIPGKQDGKPVRTQFFLPVKFKLDSSSTGDDTHREQKADLQNHQPRFAACDEMPTLVEKEKCAQRELFFYINDIMDYSKTKNPDKKEGKILVTFTVNADGVVEDVVLKNSIGATDFEQELLMVVSSMPKWVPGEKDGKAVAMQVELPVQLAPQNIDPDDVSIFEVFPNPSNINGFTLKFKAKAGPVSLMVVDVATGRELVRRSFDTYEGGLQEAIFDGLFEEKMARGSVIVSLMDKGGKALKSAKVLIQ